MSTLVDVMPYQLTTSTPYQGGPAVDLALVLAPGKVVAVIQVSRTTLQLQQWTCSTGPPALKSVGASLLGDGSVPTAVSSTPTGAAVAYHVPGSNLVRLAWLSMVAGSPVPDSESSYTGGRVSISGFVSTIDVPEASKGPKPTGRDGVVNIGPYGQRVVTAFNSKAKPNNMLLKFGNVPYDTTTLLEEPAGYHSLGMANARRPSIVGQCDLSRRPAARPMRKRSASSIVSDAAKPLERRSWPPCGRTARSSCRAIA